MIGRIIAPVPPLASSLMGVGLAVVYLDAGLLAAVLVGLSPLLVVVPSYVIGRKCLPRHPYVACWFIEAGLLVLVVLAAAAAGGILVFAILKSPGEHASVREKETFAALAAAVGGYFGTLLIKPDGEIWNPVKDAIKATFKGNFKPRRDNMEKDARDAVSLDQGYGAQYVTEVVSGWDWRSRRQRSRQIQRAVQAGYLKPEDAE